MYPSLRDLGIDEDPMRFSQFEIAIMKEPVDEVPPGFQVFTPYDEEEEVNNAIINYHER